MFFIDFEDKIEKECIKNELPTDKVFGLIKKFPILLSINDNLNYKTVMNNNFVDNLAREVMKGMRETSYQCRYTGGQLPLGYDVDLEKKYIINNAEAEIVRKIFDMYINGYSYSQIIDYLNERGWKTKAGNTFGKNSIYSILDNEKYSGVYIFNRSSKKDAFGKRNSHLFKNESEVIRIEEGMLAIVSKRHFKSLEK